MEITSRTLNIKYRPDLSSSFLKSLYIPSPTVSLETLLTPSRQDPFHNTTSSRGSLRASQAILSSYSLKLFSQAILSSYSPKTFNMPAGKSSKSSRHGGSSSSKKTHTQTFTWFCVSKFASCLQTPQHSNMSYSALVVTGL